MFGRLSEVVDKVIINGLVKNVMWNIYKVTVIANGHVVTGVVWGVMPSRVVWWWHNCSWQAKHQIGHSQALHGHTHYAAPLAAHTLLSISPPNTVPVHTSLSDQCFTIWLRFLSDTFLGNVITTSPEERHCLRFPVAGMLQAWHSWWRACHMLWHSVITWYTDPLEDMLILEMLLDYEVAYLCMFNKLKRITILPSNL